MQSSLNAETLNETAPTLYRKEFLKDAYGRVLLAANKLDYARNTAEAHLPVAKDMISRMPEFFAQANIFMGYLTKNPGKASAAGFNKNVFYESTPDKMQELKIQLDCIAEAMAKGMTATTGDEFTERTAIAQQTVRETLAEMAKLASVQQKQR